MLATLGAEFVAYLREDREMSLEQIAAGFEDLIRTLAARQGARPSSDATAATVRA